MDELDFSEEACTKRLSACHFINDEFYILRIDGLADTDPILYSLIKYGFLISMG